MTSTSLSCIEPKHAAACLQSLVLDSYSAYQPAQHQSTPFHPERSSSASKFSVKSSLAEETLSQRKTMRTYLRSFDGVLSDAQIDLRTGEVVPCRYRQWPKPLRARPTVNPSLIDPPWLRICASSRGMTMLERDKSRKKLFNHLKPRLDGYLTLDEALVDLPRLENILHGALSLDMGGNTRSMNVGLVFVILQQLTWLTAETVQNFMDCSLRHAQKMMQVLSVIVSAVLSEDRIAGILFSSEAIVTSDMGV